jgi:hypothetical protein
MTGTSTQKQVDYILALVESKDLSSLSDVQREWLQAPNLNEVLPTITKQKASDIIGTLKVLPKKAVEAVATEAATAPPTTKSSPEQESTFANLALLESQVKPGRYFVVDPTAPEGKQEKFIKVDKPEPPSRWAGRTFLSSQASDDFYPIKDPKQREILLYLIYQDPIKAMNEYGMRLGVCGNCGRTLTARDSRLRGIGPICAEKILGTASPEDVNLLNQLGLV